jgi:hypothetical protein
MNAWTQEQAKASFDSLLENALGHQEQIIQLKNQQKVVVISLEDYLKQKPRKKPLGSWLVENMRGLGELSLPDRKETGCAFSHGVNTNV